MTHHQKRRKFIQERTIISNAQFHLSYPDDKNNCTIRAISIAYGIPYHTAYKFAQQAGRKHQDGFYTSQILKVMAQHNFYYKICLPPIKNLSVYRLLHNPPQGRFIFTTTHHAFPLINGIIYDLDVIPPLSTIKLGYQVTSKKLEHLKSLYCNATGERTSYP